MATVPIFSQYVRPGDVTGSHLGSTASASAAELKTRSGTSLRRRHLLPQQQQQHHHQQQLQHQQQQPVQKRSDKPCSSQDASSQTSANKTKTSDLNGRSSSNLLSSSTSRSSAECHSPQITTVPIGLHQKAPSPAIAQDDLKELHQSLIMYTQVACRIVLHRDTEIEHLNTAADYFQAASKIAGIAEIIGIGLYLVGTFLMIAGYVPHLIYPIDLDILVILVVMTTSGQICMLFGLATVVIPNCIGYRKLSKVLNSTINRIISFYMLRLQLQMARKELLLKLNAIKLKHVINDKNDVTVLRQTFKSMEKSNTQFTLECFLFAQRQMKDKAVMSSVASLAVGTAAKAIAPLVFVVVVLGVSGCPIIAFIAIKQLKVNILPSLLLNLIVFMITISFKKLCLKFLTVLEKFNKYVSCETDRLRPLAQLFNSIIPGRLTWLRKLGTSCYFRDYSLLTASVFY